MRDARRAAQQMLREAVGLGDSGVLQPGQGALMDELIRLRVETFCRPCSCNFPDCTAPAEPFFCQADCLQRRIKPREAVSATPVQQITLIYVQQSVGELTYGGLWQLHFLVARRGR